MGQIGFIEKASRKKGSCEDEWYMYYYALPLLIVLTVLIVLFCVNCINCIIIIINCTNCIISWGGARPHPLVYHYSPY